jgi:hypothetical protein
MDDKRSKGVAKFKQMSPKGEEMIRTLLEDTAPGTYHQILEVAFGDLYQRANLDPIIRQTVSLVALAAGAMKTNYEFTSILLVDLVSPRKSYRRSSSNAHPSRAFLRQCWASAC